MTFLPPPPVRDSIVRPCGVNCVAGVTSADMFQLSDRLRAAGRDAEADAVLRALFDDPNAELRREARFRFGRSMMARHHYDAAIAQFERILTEQPGAGPVRFELARALELSGDHARALREFNRVRAGALPPDLARTIDQVVSTLRSSRPFGGSLEVGIAPDSNVNDATDATTILINGLPFQLDRASRRRSGVGLDATGQIFWRHPLAGTTRLVVDAIGRGTLYRNAALDDGSIQLGVGPEFGNRLHPALFVARRRYLGQGYSWSYGSNIQWLTPVSRRTALNLAARVEHVAVERSDRLDETIVTASAALEHALQPSLFGRLAVSANRYDAQSSGSSTVSGGTSLLLAKDFGPVSFYGQASYSHLASDGPFLGRKRLDDRFEFSGGVSPRKIRIAGVSPVIRAIRVTNHSTATLYSMAKTRIEFALSAPF